MNKLRELLKAVAARSRKASKREEAAILYWNGLLQANAKRYALRRRDDV